MNLTKWNSRLSAPWQKIQNNVFVFLDQALVSGGNFLLGILLTRFLGLEAYGVYSLLWMIALIGLSINQAFITKPLLSFGPKYLGDTRTQYLNSLHLIQWGLALGAGLLGFLVLYFGSLFGISLPDPQLMLLVPLVLITYLVYDFYRKQFFVKNQLRSPLIVDGILYGLQISGLLLLLYMDNLSVTTCFTIVLLSQATVVFGMLYIFLGKGTNWAHVKRTLEKHYEFSKWLLGTAVLQWFSGNFFIIAAAAVLGAFAVGLVRMVQNIMGLTHILFLAMENIVPVRAAQKFKLTGVKGLQHYLIQNTRQAGLLVLALLLLIAGTAPWLLKFFYGAQHMEHSWVVVAFSGIYIFVFLALPLKFALRTIEFTKPIFVAYLFTTGFSLLAAYPFLEWWGINGLLLGLLLSNVLNLMVYSYFLKTKWSGLESN